jgi:hypothetical protein
MKTITKSAAGLFLATLLISLYSCDEGIFNCIRGNGIIVTEERELNHEIYGVISEGSAEIEIIIDSVQRIEVEWDENLLPFLKTRVTGDQLIIDQGTRHCMRSSYPCRVFVYTPYIDLARLTGSGSITCDDLYTDDLKIEVTGSGYIDMRNLDALTVDAMITGSGDIILDGITDYSEFTISGSGRFECFYLEQETCVSTISGSGDMEVYASRLLDCVISGSGNIYYRGYPRIIAHISGTGNIIDSN